MIILCANFINAKEKLIDSCENLSTSMCSFSIERQKRSLRAGGKSSKIEKFIDLDIKECV